MSNREELKSQIGSFLTVDDLVELALAQSRCSQFSANSHDWSAALYDLWKEFRTQVPQLQKVSFEFRPPLPPQSEDAYRLITTLAMAGRIGLPNPSFRKVVMSKTRKEQIKRDKHRVQTEYGKLIPKMTDILETHLCKV